MNSTGGKKMSIRTRILVMVLSLIAFVFLMVMVAFNLLVGEYIKSSVNEQLQDAINMVYEEEIMSELLPDRQLPPAQMPEDAPARQRPLRGPMDRSEVMIIATDYTLIFPNPSVSFVRNYEEITALAAQLENEQTDLHSSEITRVKAADREYYFVATAAPASQFGPGARLVYYVDMTALKSFSDRINIVLLMVMAIAAILAAMISIFFSGLIAQPIRELTRFAVQIGRGDFSRNNFPYNDLELAELAASMNKAAAQLEAYDAEQKQFFQNVSHELRTPLQAIKSNAEGTRQGILDPEKSSRVIISETDRLSEMVEDLLYLSRIDSITASSKLEECDLRELLSNCVLSLKSLAEERQIQFIFDFDEQPVNMHCDARHMSRAFANIIANAIRYAATSITLTCRQTDGKITIMAADDGEGIASKDLPHIFDRFYKGSNGKHGIGLSIVKSIIEQHQGSIEAQNTGAGTLFTINFLKPRKKS